jgi:tRNA dimethylallyltransferase
MFDVPPVPGRPELRVIAVVGPTAVGKTRLAEDLATALGGEIVSADSMQVYCGMDVGTAKPAPNERRVPYHCIDLVEPGADYSAARYQHDARSAIALIADRGSVPVVVGGTGLYVRAALDEMEFPRGDSQTPDRTELEALAARIGASALHERLRVLDPASAELIHPNNVRRTIRALEMLESGHSYADQAAGFSDRRGVYDTRFIGITMARTALYERIDRRVETMLEDGLLEEVRALLDKGLRDALTAAQAIGYKELVPVLEGSADLETAIAQMKLATRRYAKRQITWFRADPRIAWIDVTEMSPEQVTSTALDLLESGTPSPYPDLKPA